MDDDDEGDYGDEYAPAPAPARRGPPPDTSMLGKRSTRKATKVARKGERKDRRAAKRAANPGRGMNIFKGITDVVGGIAKGGL